MMSNNVYKNMNMTQEQKQILKAELCTRLSYGVKAQIKRLSLNLDKPVLLDLQIKGIVDFASIYNVATVTEDGYIVYDPIVNCKPYLRPLSSMTDEEKKELFEAINKDMHLLESTLDKEPLFRYGDNLYYGNPIHYELDFLISHHFDYQGLIPMELALEAPEDMYK